MVLVKEDAVIVLWSCLAVMQVKDLDLKNVTPSLFFRKMLGISFLCLLVFVAGMLWLKWMNNWEATRSGEIAAKLQGSSFSGLRDSFLYLIIQRIQLTLPIIFIVFLFAGWRFALGAIFISIPILILNLLAGMIYSSDGDSGMHNVFSLLWAPRLSMHWAYWFSVIVVALTYSPAFLAIPSRFLRMSGCICFGLLLFSFQLRFFLRCELTRFDTLKSIRKAFEPAFMNEPYWELAAAASIAPQLPPHYPVAPIDAVFGAFHKQDIVWANMLHNAYYKPRMILGIYNEEYSPPDITTVMTHPLFMLYKEKLHIYVEAEDTCYITKAGIHGTWTDLSKK